MCVRLCDRVSKKSRNKELVLYTIRLKGYYKPLEDDDIAKARSCNAMTVRVNNFDYLFYSYIKKEGKRTYDGRYPYENKFTGGAFFNRDGTVVRFHEESFFPYICEVIPQETCIIMKPYEVLKMRSFSEAEVADIPARGGVLQTLLEDEGLCLVKNYKLYNICKRQVALHQFENGHDGMAGPLREILDAESIESDSCKQEYSNDERQELIECILQNKYKRVKRLRHHYYNAIDHSRSSKLKFFYKPILKYLFETCLRLCEQIIRESKDKTLIEKTVKIKVLLKPLSTSEKVKITKCGIELYEDDAFW